MRRSNNGPEPSARGNFTPPEQAAANRKAAEAPRPVPSSGGRFSPRNWRVPAKLNAILLIPVAVGLVMGGVGVKTSVDTWSEAQDAEKTAVLVRAALTYGDALISERDISAAPLLQGDRDNADVARARAVTDDAAVAFDSAVEDMPATPGLERRLAAFREAEPRLEPLRQAAYTSKLPGARTEEGYVAVQHPLMEFANELGLGTGNITSYGRTVYAVSLAKAAGSLQRALGTHLLLKPGPTKTDFAQQRTALGSYAYLEAIATEEYLSGGRPEDVELYEEKIAQARADGEAASRKAAAAAKAKGKKYVPSPDTKSSVGLITNMPAPTDEARQALAAKGVTPEAWWASNTFRFDAYRDIESRLADQAVAEASSIADDARDAAILTGVLVLVALLAAFALAGLMARQMSISMRKLRKAAFDVAEQKLPAMVDQLSRTDPGRVDTEVEPIQVGTTDEIGQIARAFDQVHREAVRLAAEQALLRGNINAIFTNLSRRNQALIEGQLTLITDLENNEADPDQLENLFRLDHLATRMRRNSENLLVLAGEEPGRRWDQPVPLVDVLRAASSEVESYERIELSGVPEADIHGRAVTDLVHLLAELLENATTFSSPQTKVRVTATRLPDGRVMVEIHDKGIGLTPEDFADINHRLADPPTVDAAISQRMGLFVVGRLSDRHGIRVQLRPSGEQAGTTSLVMLPEPITHGGGALQEPDQFTVSQIIPKQTAPVRNAAGQRTAAELGFDDSRYSVPDDLSGLDPVSRSLQRPDRRAALEAGTQAAPSPYADGPDRQEAGSVDHEAHGAYGTEAETAYEQAPATGPEDGLQGYQDSGTWTPTYQAPYEDSAPYDDSVSYEQPVRYEDEQYPVGNRYPEEATYRETGAYEGYQQQEYPGGVPAAEGEQYYAPDLAAGAQGAQGAQHTPYDQGSDELTGHRPYPGFPSGAGPAYGGRPDDELSREQGTAAGDDGYVDDWPLPDGGYRGPRPAQEQAPAADSYEVPDERPESRRESAATGPERVGFHLQGSAATAPAAGHDLTEAGLPRRGLRPVDEPVDEPDVAETRHSEAPAAAEDGHLDSQDAPDPLGSPEDEGSGPRDDWQSANDERWQRAEKLRRPSAGGVTTSGLPRRVPRANLVEGTAEQTPQGGPQVSRDPEDVRGRLSNLHRGVRRGRNNAGSETNGRADENHGGPDSTYNQER